MAVISVILACNFQSGLCGMTRGGADFNWVRKSGSSPAGPAAGHSTGTGKHRNILLVQINA